MTSRGRLAGRVVVVTDADSDRGARHARALAQDGAALVLAGADTGALGVLASELAQGHGARVAVFAGDTDDYAGRAALAELLAELFSDR